METAIDLFVIQPTPFCNINCSYCYLPDRSNTKKITPDIINKIIDSLINDRLIGNQLSIVWHAGEPLVLSPSFYEPLFTSFSKRLSSQDIVIHHSIQTNGTLITQEWCDFIVKYNIKIGISIDGPREINDANRKTRNGRGTFDKIMQGIALLQQNNIVYHAIAVINEKSINDPETFFNFFYNNGFYNLGLNIEEVEGVNKHSSIFESSLYEKSLTFYSHLFNLYKNSDNHMGIREFDQALNAILRNPDTAKIEKLSVKTHQNVPMGIISVDYEGNFSTFSPELIGQFNNKYNNFIFGNIHEISFLQINNSKTLKTILIDIDKGIKKCKKDCEFFYVCGGGAPANKFFENGSFNSSETNYCKYNIKIPTEITMAFLEEKLRIDY